MYDSECGSTCHQVQNRSCSFRQLEIWKFKLPTFFYSYRCLGSSRPAPIPPQCRQKTTDGKATCGGAGRTESSSSKCRLSWCTKCLFNRYGQKVEEVMAKQDWECPKCLKECNCSNCRCDIQLHRAACSPDAACAASRRLSAAKYAPADRGQQH